jgi:beta-lactamase regulating signal transducer with metallopeptidase domain
MMDAPRLLLSPETLIYLFNIAAASCLACGSGLLVAWFCRRRPAPLKHAILLAAICLSLLSPAVLYLSQAFGRGVIRVPTPFRAVLSERDDVLLESSASIQSIGRSESAKPSVVDRHDSVIATRPSPEVPGIASGDTTTGINWRFWQTVGTLLGCIWAVGTVQNVVFLGRGVIELIRFRTSLSESDNPRLTQAACWAMRSLGSRQDVQVWSSRLIPSPLSLGGPVRPIIAIPEDIEYKLDKEQLRAVFVHEAAHIVRGDHWIGLLQRAAVVLFWWNPLLRGASHRVSLLREQICDDHVVSVLGDGRRYAETLVEVAGYCALPSGRTCAVGLLGHELGDIEGRITRLLDKERTMSTQMNRRMFALAAVFTATLFGLLLVPAVEATDELAISAAGSANTLHTVQEARLAIKARLNAIQSVVVKYDRVDTYTPVPGTLKPPRTVTIGGHQFLMVTKAGTEKHHCEFRYLAGLARYEERLSKEMLALPNQIQARFRIMSILPDRVEHLSRAVCHHILEFSRENSPYSHAGI